MKTLLNQYSQLVKTKTLYALAASLMAVTMSGCGGSAADNGQIITQVQLPTDAFSYLYCPEVGVGEEGCVLEDPANVYSRSAVTDVTKWLLLDDIDGMASKKPMFYLWATALARLPSGENQFYTAQTLHTIFSLEQSELARDQAKKAYRSLLDNFYGSVTFDSTGQIQYFLRDWTADRIVNPATAGLPQLFDSQAVAIQALNDWGYEYNTNTAMISKKPI